MSSGKWDRISSWQIICLCLSVRFLCTQKCILAMMFRYPANYNIWQIFSPGDIATFTSVLKHIHSVCCQVKRHKNSLPGIAHYVTYISYVQYYRRLNHVFEQLVIIMSQTLNQNLLGSSTALTVTWNPVTLKMETAHSSETEWTYPTYCKNPKEYWRNTVRLKTY